MNFKNSGKGDSNILQNQFTAYLQVALRRRKRDYLAKQALYLNREISEEDAGPLPIIAQDFEAELSYEFQVENDVLLQALAQLSDRERMFLLAHVLDEVGFDVLAQERGLSYKGTATAYYRLCEKIRKYMEGKK